VISQVCWDIIVERGEPGTVPGRAPDAGTAWVAAGPDQRLSHHTFKHADGRVFPVPVHGGKVKPVYVRKAKKLCGEG
jgi:hypothetical protein